MKYFIIIDMQNDFLTGSLKNSAAEKVVSAIVEKAKELKAKGYKIIATRDTHYHNYMETQEGKNLPVPHCIYRTEGWEVVDPIKEVVDVTINKDTFGCLDWKFFFNTYAEKLEDKKIEEIAMCGTCTSICVVSNFSILKASYPETPITVYKDLCACLTPETHNAAITVMQTQQAIIV